MKKQQLRHGVSIVAAIFGVAAATAGAQAQAVDRYSQGLQRGPAREVALTPRALPDGSSDTTPLVPSLRGVVIVNDPAQVATSARAAGVEVRGDAVPDAAVSAAAAFLGGAVSLASLDDMTRQMVLAYRKAGVPVVNVVVPPQDITNGVIQVIAVVGRLGQLNVAGETSNPGYYSEDFPVAQGDVIREGPVLDHLRWKSRRLHRTVSAIYEPGAAFSETDITLDVREDKPWAVFGGIDNTGSADSVGELRIFAGFTIADLPALDHEISYQYTTSEDGPDALSAHVLSWTLPVLARTDLQLTGAYVTTGADGTVASDGTSYQLGATFISQLSRKGPFSLEARYGFEYKNSDNNLEFGGVTVSDNTTEIGQLHLMLTGQRGDAGSTTTMFGGVWYSPGDLFDANDNASFRGTRSGAEARYAYFRGGIDHTIFLPGDFRFVTETEAQLSNARLLPSEQMYIGGFNTVRGFDENTGKGDNGALARFELHTPGHSLLGEEKNDQLRLYGFFDIAQVASVSPVDAATDRDGTLGGAGIGLTYNIGNHFSAELAYGWAVVDSADLSQDDGQFHFRAVARF